VILVDSSAWIEFQRATDSPADRRLTEAFRADELLATTGIVTLEVLAGARDEHQARELRRLLARCRFLPMEEPSDHEAAAALYRACRRAGTTIRRLPDCLIATVAIRNRAELLHCDSDFDAIARHTPLAIVPIGSPRPPAPGQER
jgi:predicted nucleic acid-binding protein